MEQVYQVFINHRGPDTKKNLASPIYHRLTSYGLRVFFDREELRTGNDVYPAIDRAIDSASVHIALFSKRYAQSRPCLDELCRMMNRRADCKFIPVFFDVEPSHLSGIDRSPYYAKAFAEHQLNVDQGKRSVEVVEGWKKALREAALSSGLVFKTGESDFGELMESIVESVLKDVKRDLLDVATYPVGLDEAAEEFQNKIMNPSELNAPKIVLIAGMGGLGKSTLAKHLYNVRRSDFTRSCFLADVRKMDKLPLWQQLVRDLLGRDVPCTTDGKSNLRDGLSGKRILVVFDDVEDKGKITSLLDMDAVEPGSLILITSRHKDIPRALKSILYDVKPLKRKHARELFCRHAFDKSKPPEEYETLVEEFLKFCGGLPLCLEVLGEKLGENLDRKDWMQQLNNYFNQGQPLTEAESVINRLMWSYEALKTDEEKGIFLDIGCFLVGEAKELAIRVLEGLGWVNVAVRLNDLRQKCFLEFCSDVQSEVALLDISKGCHKIIMHEQVRELARHIARKDKDKPLRISCSYDIDQILQLQPALSPCLIRGIRIPQDHQPPKSIPQDHQLPKSMINILGLRLFVVEHHIDFSWIWGPGGQTWNLVWLRLCHCSLSSIALTISLRNLRVLELQGSDSDITYPWQRVTMEGYPGQLQELNIQFPSETSLESMTRMVGIIGQSTNLNKIEFKNITNMQSFPIDPVSYTNLHFSMPTNLTHLDLSGCTNLIQLPDSFSKCLRLQYLALTDCENLPIPTDILGEISTLEYVDFSGCVQLKHLPNGMAYQKSLRCLDLRRTSLLQLPNNLKLLVKLEELRIASPKLTELPDSVGDLIGLKELILLDCPCLHISTSLKRLTRLERLVIYNWGVSSSLMQVEGLPSSLVKLMLMNCSKLKALTNLSNLVNLKLVNIVSCEELETVNVEGLIQLEEIQVYECSKLQKIGTLNQLERLNCLGITTYNENGVIYDDILPLLTSRSQMSTAFFNAVTDDDDQKIELEKVVRRILGNFETVLDVPATTTSVSPVKLENLHSYGAILMCFIPYSLGFDIRFGAGNNPAKYLDYNSQNGTGSGVLDICLWTEDSKLFDFENFYNDVAVYCPSPGSGNDLDKGWIVPLATKTEGLEIFKQFIVELRSMNGLRCKRGT